MKERPILFSTPMVQAILAGRKTMTRRVVKFPKDFTYQNVYDNAPYGLKYTSDFGGPTVQRLSCPYGQPGDVLWVRETWRPIEQEHGGPRYEYKATEKINTIDTWKPSTFMPRSACRIFLEITNVRVERLNDITEADARSEGVSGVEPGELFFNFMSLWQSINGPDSWEKNPWVWVVEFKRIER